MEQNRKNLKPKLNDCIRDFSKYGRKSNYYRKKLSGNWYGYEELELGGDIRIIIRIHEIKPIAVFELIGTHSQLGL